MLKQQKNTKRKKSQDAKPRNKFIADTTALQRTQGELNCKEQKGKLTVGQGRTDGQHLAPLSHTYGICVTVVSKVRQVNV